MIEWIGTAPDGLSRGELDHLFVTFFVSNGGIDRRLREQGVTGTVVERDGRYILTNEGRLMRRAFQLAQWVFACETRPADLRAGAK